MLIGTTAAVISLTGCGGEEEPKPLVQAEPEVVIERAPAPPPVTPVSELMAQYGIDDRVRLMEQDAPGTDAERIAVLQFFHAMMVQHSEFEKMLSSEDRMEFNGMMQGDTMGDAISEVTEIRLQCGASPDFKTAVVAIIETYDGWQPQLWTYQVSSNPMGGLPPVFTSGPTPLSVMSRLSGSGQVQQWYQLLDEELTIANRPEEDADAVKVDMRNELDNVSEAGSGAPVGPGGMPGRVKPKRDRKLDAPSLSPSR
ncbi:MAG: hypothetical protein VX641_06140 [Planctomycetota bacterium]|nr:hypothetical protein [Planctomycetota bacterium]